MPKKIDAAHAIVIKGDFNSWEVAESPGVAETRDAIIAGAKALKPIADEAGLQAALEVKRQCRTLRKGVEDVEKALKKPLNELKSAIIAKAEGFLAPLIAAEKNTEGMINNFQTRQLDAQREAEKKAAKEIAEKAQQTGATVDNIEEMRARVADMHDASRLHGLDPDEQEELTRLESELLDLELAYEALPTVEDAAKALAKVEVKGVNSKRVLDFRVKGSNQREQWENTVAFCQAYPELCKIEISVTAVRARLNDGDCFKSHFPEEQPEGELRLPRPPGIEVFEAVKTNIR